MNNNVLAIPATTLEVKISAKVWLNGEAKTVERTMSFDEVRSAIQEAQDGYIPSDALFMLNPDYDKSKLQRLIEKYCLEDKDESRN